MGKRQLGELQPSELVITIMISELASIPIENKDMSILEGLIPVLTLVLLELLVSVLAIKSEIFRTLITGRPTIIVRNGKIEQRLLRRLRLSLDDLLEQLRLSGYSSISEVDTVLLETNGQISVIPKELSRPVTIEDLSLKPEQTHLPHTLIADGKVRESGLKAANVSKARLEKMLRAYGVKAREVFYMNITDNGEVFMEKKDKKQ